MTLHQQFLKIAKEKRLITNKLLFLLPKIFKSGEYKKYAKTIEGYAFRFAGIPESTTRKALNLYKYIENKPKFQTLVKQVGVHKVSAVATILKPENEDILIEKLKTLSLSAINQLAKETRGADKSYKISLNLTEGQYKLLNLVSKQLGPNETPEKILEKLCCLFLQQNETNQQPIEHNENHSRHIPSKIKKAVVSKYNSHCAYPGCLKKFDEIHHQVHFAKSKVHDLNKLVTLCKEHHEFMHNNLISNSDMDPMFWQLSPAFTVDKHDLKYRKMRL